MKLDQKCVDAILHATPGMVLTTNPDVLPHTYFEVDNGATSDVELVPESECEFWVHKELNAAIREMNSRLWDGRYKPIRDLEAPLTDQQVESGIETIESLMRRKKDETDPGWRERAKKTDLKTNIPENTL